MINEASEPRIKKALNHFVQEQNLERLKTDKKLQRLKLSNFNLKEEDFQTIKVQLRALGLIAESERNRSVKDVSTYWTLTPYGDDTMTRLRAIKRTIVTEQEPEVSKEKKKD